jgi:hypothetical protein
LWIQRIIASIQKQYSRARIAIIVVPVFAPHTQQLGRASGASDATSETVTIIRDHAEVAYRAADWDCGLIKESTHYSVFQGGRKFSTDHSLG